MYLIASPRHIAYKGNSEHSVEAVLHCPSSVKGSPLRTLVCIEQNRIEICVILTYSTDSLTIKHRNCFQLNLKVACFISGHTSMGESVKFCQ